MNFIAKILIKGFNYHDTRELYSSRQLSTVHDTDTVINLLVAATEVTAQVAKLKEIKMESKDKDSKAKPVNHSLMRYRIHKGRKLLAAGLRHGDHSKSPLGSLLNQKELGDHQELVTKLEGGLADMSAWLGKMPKLMTEIEKGADVVVRTLIKVVSIS